MELYFEHLLTEIHKTIPVETETGKLLEPILSVLHLPKKSFLLRPGQTAHTMNFIVKGCMRCYYLDDNGSEHILQFGIENWWVNDLYSYLSLQPSRMFIQAIENSVIVQIRKAELDKLYLESSVISNFFRIKIQKAYMALQERVISEMSKDAYQRYQLFIKEYRDIEQRIPQYMVASYLGITPEFLSHLRNKSAARIS